MTQKDKDFNKNKENKTNRTQNIIEFNENTSDIKRYKNRLAAKKSREKKNEYLRHLEKENEFLKNDIDFLLKTIFQYDGLSGALISFLDILLEQHKLLKEDYEYIFMFLMELSSKGFSDIEGFLKRDMQINNQRIMHILQRIHDINNKTHPNSINIYFNDEDNNFM